MFQKHKLVPRLVAVVAAALVAADLWVPLYDPLVADEGNAVYSRVAAAPPGRLLEVPPLPPDDYAGSVYLYYAMQAPRERPLGIRDLRAAGGLPHGSPPFFGGGRTARFCVDSASASS